jgi:hypothetical protein
MGGDPLGELQRQRAALSGAQDEVNDLTARLERATARRDRYAGNVDFFGQRAAAFGDAAVRSAPLNELEASRHIRESMQKVRAEYNDDVMARARARQAARRLGRPKESSRSGGDAVRSDSPEPCPACMEMGATAEEALRIHQASADEHRSEDGRTPMIYR